VVRAEDEVVGEGAVAEPLQPTEQVDEKHLEDVELAQEKLEEHPLLPSSDEVIVEDVQVLQATTEAKEGDDTKASKDETASDPVVEVVANEVEQEGLHNPPIVENPGSNIEMESPAEPQAIDADVSESKSELLGEENDVKHPGVEVDFPTEKAQDSPSETVNGKEFEENSTVAPASASDQKILSAADPHQSDDQAIDDMKQELLEKVVSDSTPEVKAEETAVLLKADEEKKAKEVEDQQNADDEENEKEKDEKEKDEKEKEKEKEKQQEANEQRKKEEEEIKMRDEAKQRELLANTDSEWRDEVNHIVCFLNLYHFLMSTCVADPTYRSR